MIPRTMQRRSKGAVFVGPVMMHTLKGALRERRKTPLPKKGSRYAEAYQPLAMHGHERLSVIRDLKRHGYSPFVPVRSYDVRGNPQLKNFVTRARKAGAKVVETDIMFSPSTPRPIMGMEMPPDPNVVWIADAHRLIGNEIHNTVSFNGNQHLRRAGVRKKTILSSAGESGAIVGHGKVLLVTKKIEKEDVDRLRQMGHKVYVMPTFKKRSEEYYRPDAYRIQKTTIGLSGRTKPEVKREAHLDIRINIIERANLIIVDPAYYRANRSIIRGIAGANGLKIEIVSGRTLLPTNFLWLPDGKVMINKSEKLKAVLEKHGLKEGKDFIVSSMPIKYNRYLGGGMGCFATAMPMGKKLVKYGKWGKVSRMPPVKMVLTPQNVDSFPHPLEKKNTYFISLDWKHVHYSLSSALEAFGKEKESDFFRKETMTNYQRSEELYQRGLLTRASRRMIVGGTEYTEYVYYSVLGALEKTIPSKELIDAINWVHQHGSSPLFETERVPGIDGSDVYYWLKTKGERKQMTDQEHSLKNTLSTLSRIGVLRRRQVSGNIFEGEERYFIAKIPKAWLPYLKE